MMGGPRRTARRTRLALFALVALPLLVGATATRAATLAARHAAERTTWDSVFTTEQADRGQLAYSRSCARCHRETLAGGDEAVALTGSAFMSAWNGLPLHDLHERIRTTMPSDTPGVYAAQHVTDVVAFMLRVNGFPAGHTELTHRADSLKEIRFVAGKP